MEQRMKEVDDQRYQKNDLTKRFNESNVISQHYSL